MQAVRPCKRRRRANAPVPRCRYRGVRSRPSGGLTATPEGAPARDVPTGHGRRRPRSGPASGAAGGRGWT
nr:MAG TPA: hypothetical protein [Caudoviricetes sp.]